MADSTINVNFTASVSDLVSGLSATRDALSSLDSPSQQLQTQSAALGENLLKAFDPSAPQAFAALLSDVAGQERSLATARTQAAEALKSGDQQAYAAAVSAADDATREEIRIAQAGLKEKLAALNEELRTHQITMVEKVRLSEAALDEEHQAEIAMMQGEAALGPLSLDQQRELLDQKLAADIRFHEQEAALNRQSLDAQYRDYQAFGNSINSAFDGQLRGLLNGTETWRTAFKSVLEDLLIKFIEWSGRTVVEYLAGEAAKTAATTAAAAARTGVEEAGATASLAVQGATVIRSILSSAAEAFAGVFGFLAPILGPAAAGPAAGAYGAVAGMTGAVASADIGMWQVPNDMLTLVHHNELIMPANEAGSFRQMLAGGTASSQPAVHVAPTTHFHLSAVDSGSVDRWMRGNSASLVKALDEAVRHGAHLATRRLRTL